MSKTRIKVVAAAIQTRDEAEAVLNELAIIANNKRKVTAQMDGELLAIKDKYQPGLTMLTTTEQAKAQQLEV